MPTNIPNCREPFITETVVELTTETDIIKRIAAKMKQRSEPAHIVILKPALSFGALTRTKMKLRTPKTTARYKRRIEMKRKANGAPKKSDEVSPIREPQLSLRRVLRVKSTRVNFSSPARVNGRLTEYFARGRIKATKGTKVQIKRIILSLEPNRALLKFPVNLRNFLQATSALAASSSSLPSQLKLGMLIPHSGHSALTFQKLRILPQLGQFATGHTPFLNNQVL